MKYFIIKLFFLVASASILFSCVADNVIVTSDMLNNKADVKLMEQIQKTESNTPISFLIVGDKDFTVKQTDEIINLGIVINTVAGNVATGIGTTKQIIKLAQYDFVLRLEKPASYQTK
ncbi:MAG: hypothetical protein Q8T08_00445 [Ignavibacteria bacterium]|nr:hypothetical protein [Ignavibacteria bacterium]